MDLINWSLSAIDTIFSRRSLGSGEPVCPDGTSRPDMFPLLQVMCLWYMCFRAEVFFFSVHTLYSQWSIVWEKNKHFPPLFPHVKAVFFTPLSYVCCVCMDRWMANFAGTCY